MTYDPQKRHRFSQVGKRQTCVTFLSNKLNPQITAAYSFLFFSKKKRNIWSLFFNEHEVLDCRRTLALIEYLGLTTIGFQKSLQTRVQGNVVDWSKKEGNKG